KLSVHGIGICPQPLCDLLSEAGAQIDDAGELSLVVVDQYLRPEISRFNESAIRSGRPWLLVKPFGAQLWLGPMFVPGKTGCWKCLYERLSSNRAVETYLRQRNALNDTLVVDTAGTTAGRHASWGLVANAIISWIVRGDLPDLVGNIRTFDQLTWQLKNH